MTEEKIIKVDLTARMTMFCPAKAKVAGLVDAGAASFRTIIGKKKLRDAVYGLYVDEEKSENLYAEVRSITSGGEVLDEADISLLLDKDYAIAIKSRDNSDLELEMTINSETEVSSDMSGYGQQLQEVVKKKIDEGILTEETWKKIKEVLDDNKVDLLLQLRIAEDYRSYKKLPSHPGTVYFDADLDKRIKDKGEGLISEGLRSVADRQAFICKGDKSVGKDCYVRTIAWLAQKPLYSEILSEQTTPSDVRGGKTTDNTASAELGRMSTDALLKAFAAEKAYDAAVQRNIESGMDAAAAADIALNTLPEEMRNAIEVKMGFEVKRAQAASAQVVMDESQLYDCISDGGIFCFDEFNNGDANFITMIVHPLIDGTGALNFPGRGVVRVHKDFVLAATQNMDYAGLGMQNEATLSRFNMFSFPNTKSIKNQLVRAVTSELKAVGMEMKLDMDYFSQTDKFYKELYRAATDEDHVISAAALNIRGCIRALVAVARGGGVPALRGKLDCAVVEAIQNDAEREAVRTLLSATVDL